MRAGARRIWECLTHPEPEEHLLETDPTRMCELFVGSPDVDVVGVGDWPLFFEPPRGACSQVVWVVAMMAGVFEACQLASCSRGGM